MSLRGVLTLIILLAGLGAACASQRTVMDVTRPEVLPAASAAKAFRIVKMVDERSFELRPRTHDVPTLSDEAIHDQSVTARAFARSRGVAGQTRGDFLLPEGSSVAELAHDCVASAVSRVGGVLVASGDPRAATAIPLTVYVKRLWSYQSAAFHHGSVIMQFDGAIEVRAPLPGFEQGLSVEARTSQRIGGETKDSFEQITAQGLMSLTQALVKRLEPAVASLAPAEATPTQGGELSL